MAWVVWLCFFLSGASGLVFEEVWTRDLTLVFGSTTLALSTVLSVFMGGLALGSRIGGRFADRIQDRLRAYALAEAGVGLYALVVPAILAAYPALNHLLYRGLGDHSVALSLGRFVAAALLLLIPTTLMGATLPILSRHFVEPGSKTSRIGATVGTLYAINTFGAVVGTFVGGFVLLPGVGVRLTNYTAAATNLTLAALVMLVRSRLAKKTEDPWNAPVEEPPAPADEFEATDAQRRLALWAFAISGAVAMVYQVLWTRSLAIVIGSSIYSFTLILLAFLIGLGVGAAFVARMTKRSRDPVAWLGVVHLGTAAMIALSYIVMDKLPAAFLALLRGSTLSVDGIIFCQFLLAALAVLPATLLMGGVFPLTVRIYASGADRVGRDVGTAYSVNTLGAIIGSFAAGFVVLPSLGLQRGLALGGILTVLLASAFLWMSRARLRKPLALAFPIAAVCVSLVLPRWSLEHFSAGLFRVSIAKDIIESQKWAIPKLEYYHDGIATTVSVERWGKTVALKNNGKVDASNGDDMATQIMVGLMPLIFHPTALEKPPRVAVVGYGSGVTIGAVTQFPIGHADVVELEPAVVDAGTKYFGEYNHHPEKDPRIKIIIGDGRNFLTQKDDKYDAIISEPSNPWITGVSNLFTVDYWKLARSRLADDGVFCQWAQLYEMSSKNIKTILRSFSEVFPYTYVFAAEDLSSDVILVAANHPLGLDLGQLRRNFTANPVLSAELKRGGVASAEDLVAQLLLVPEELPAFTAGSPDNTDDNALIEFNAPRDLLGSTRTSDPYLARVYATEWPYGRFDKHLVLSADKAGDELALARALLAHGKRTAAERFLDRALKHGATGDSPTEKLLTAMRERHVDDPEVPLVVAADHGDVIPPAPKGLTEAEQKRMNADWQKMLRAARGKAWAHALAAIKDWPERWVDDAGPDFQLLLGFLLYKVELPDDAVDKLKPLLDEHYEKTRPALLYYLARAEYADGLFDAAVRNMTHWLDGGTTVPPFYKPLAAKTEE